MEKFLLPNNKFHNEICRTQPPFSVIQNEDITSIGSLQDVPGDGNCFYTSHFNQLHDSNSNDLNKKRYEYHQPEALF